MPNLLIIAERPAERETILSILNQEGYQITAIATYEEVLQATDHTIPDLILISDLDSFINGNQICRKLRSMQRFTYLPIICITNGATPEQINQILEDGADDHISTPLDPQLFKGRVKTRIERTWLYKKSSPLTGLPGNPVVELELRRRIASKEQLAVAYIDIDYFKSYNDHYGWLRGDEVIQLTARIIQEVIDQECDEQCFLGHLGGDDFVAIIPPEVAEPCAKALIKEFDRQIPNMYPQMDRERGYILQRDRLGNLYCFPLLSISIAICTNRQRELVHPGQVAQIGVELKGKLKSCLGSSYMIDRRSGD